MNQDHLHEAMRSTITDEAVVASEETICRAIRRDLGPFVDGELSVEQRSRVAQHLDECGACAQHLREIAELGSLLRTSLVRCQGEDKFFDGMASGVISQVRAESAASWRARLSRACDDWHWAIVASGSIAATFVSTLVVTIILVFGPAPAREDSLSALMANLGQPAGMLFVCASASGSDQDAMLLQVENSMPAASRMTAALAEMACQPVSEADVTRKLATVLTGASGRVVRLDSMHRAEREYTESLLTEIARIRASQTRVVGRAVNVHEVRLVTGMAVVGKAL